MLNNLSGVSALQDALSTTNTLLEAVLEQLKETNSERLDEIAKELRAVNEKLDKNPLSGDIRATTAPTVRLVSVAIRWQRPKQCLPPASVGWQRRAVA